MPNTVGGAPIAPHTVEAPLVWPSTFLGGGALPSLTTQATAYIVKGDGEAAIARVAQALGMTGPVTKSVSTPDGVDQWEVVSGTRHLVVTAALLWYLEDLSPPSKLASGCAGKPTVPPTTPVDCLTSDEAKKIAHTVASNLGIDLANDWEQFLDDSPKWSVTINPQVGGLPTSGYELFLEIGANGKVVRGAGLVGSPSIFDMYPLVTPAEGLARLTDFNYAMGGGSPTPMLTATDSNPTAVSGSQPPTVVITVPPTTYTGPPTTVAPWLVHFTAARLVLVPRWNSKSEMLLVPAYEYLAPEGFSTWLAVAVSGDFLAKAATTLKP